MFPLSDWKCFLLGMPSTEHKTVKCPSNNPKFLSFFGMYHYLPKWTAQSPTIKLPLGKLLSKTPFLSVFRNSLIKRKLFILKSIKLFPLKKQSTKDLKCELEELQIVHGHEKPTPALSKCTKSRRMKWGNDICREKHLMWDSTKNMGCRLKLNFVLREWNATWFHISLTITALTFQSFNALTRKSHVFSPFQSMYLNFSATEGQVKLQTQDKILSFWKQSGSIPEELVPPHAWGASPTRRFNRCRNSCRI